MQKEVFPPAGCERRSFTVKVSSYDRNVRDAEIRISVKKSKAPFFGQTFWAAKLRRFTRLQDSNLPLLREP